MKKLFLLIAIFSFVVTTSVAQHRPHRRGHRPHIERKSSVKAPEFLKKGDKIAILSPSSVPTDLSIIDKGAAVLQGWGFKTVEGKYARTNYHTYAGTPEQRVEDILWALRDPSIKAIVCSRGGYGCMQILDMITAISLAT